MFGWLRQCSQKVAECAIAAVFAIIVLGVYVLFAASLVGWRL